MGQLTGETEGVPPFLHVTVPAVPAAIVAWPSKSQVSGAAEAHLGGLVIQAHLAETLLMPTCKKRNGSMFATTAPKRVAEMLRRTAMTKHLVSAELEGTKQSATRLQQRADSGSQDITASISEYKTLSPKP